MDPLFCAPVRREERSVALSAMDPAFWAARFESMSELTRRAALKFLTSTGASSVSVGAGLSTACKSGSSPQQKGDLVPSSHEDPSPRSQALEVFDLPKGRPWPTPDPFLFCVHHNDRFPKGNGSYGPAASLEGRQMGMDFSWKDGWNMYHGRDVPGFPAHPHRGFETVTVVRSGRLDHADSLGAAARYGDGDVQWLTAGSGIQHAEMFPLLSTEKQNPLDLFQIWLNLPKKSKMVAPYFSMLWADDLPRLVSEDADGNKTEIEIRAGRLGETHAPPPPPDSWAADPANEVTILTGKMDAGAQVELPAVGAGINRFLYFFEGKELRIGTRSLRSMQGAMMSERVPIELKNGSVQGEFLLLQGRPINEPVAQHGPFVMNTRQELQEAYQDYQRTQFGGWPWPGSGPVHGDDPARFARRTDGSIERPGSKTG